MASSARIFFAGVGTTFAILALGFGGGLLLAKSALHDPPVQARVSAEPPAGMRVILPASAEPALQVRVPASALEPQPMADLQAAADKQVEKANPKKAERDVKAERRRHAERKARKMATEKARQRTEPQQWEPGIMAFGGDEPRSNFFGN